MFDLIPQVVEDFLLDGESRGHSHNTINAYRNALRFFVAFTQEKKLRHLSELSPALLREYAVHCSDLLSPGGAHARLRPVKTMLKWAQQEELVEHDLTKRMTLPKLPREPQATVRLADFHKLLAAAKLHSRCPLRDKALLTVLFDTGIRASEALALQLDDIRPEGFLLIKRGKGGKPRAVPVERSTVRVSRAYILHERNNDSGLKHLFLTGDHPMSRGTLDKMLERTSTVAGLPRLSAHAFRRGFAVQYLRNGGDVFTLQRIFGHSSLEMSNRYANLIDDDLKTAHIRSSPLRKGTY